MKKFLILLAFVALPLLFACNKTFNADYASQMTNRPTNITVGSNIDVAKTYTTPGTPKFKTKKDGNGKEVLDENGKPVPEVDGDGKPIQEKTANGDVVLTRSAYSLNSDGDGLYWDEDYVEGVKSVTSVTIIRKYNFRTCKYSVTTKVTEDQGTVTTIKLDLEEKQDVSIEISSKGETEQVEIVVSHQNEQGETVVDNTTVLVVESEPDQEKDEALIINGTWKVKNTTAVYRGLTFNRDGLDVHAIAAWANENGWVKEEDVKGTEGYNVTSVMVMDSAIAINFENGKSFATSFNSNSLSNFAVKDFAGDDADAVSKYFNGTGSFSFFDTLCILTIQGELKGKNANEADTKLDFKLSLVR